MRRRRRSGGVLHDLGLDQREVGLEQRVEPSEAAAVGGDHDVVVPTLDPGQGGQAPAAGARVPAHRARHPVTRPVAHQGHGPR